MFIGLMRCLGLLFLATQFASAEDVDDCNSEQSVLTQAQQLVESQVADPATHVELAMLTAMPMLKQSKVRLLSQTLQSRLVIELSGVSCSSGQAQRATVWLALSLRKTVWVYGIAAGGNQPISVSMPHQQTVNLIKFALTETDLARSFDGAWLVRPVRAGYPILNKDLQVEPLVQRDQDVSVLIQGDGLQIKTRGKALRFGHLGDRIPVLLNGSRQSINAVVRAQGVVDVEM